MTRDATTPVERWCDNCGRQVLRMHRVHKGKAYCSGCYASEFKPVPCSGCTGTARMHRRDSSEPLCGACRRIRRTCVRCGKCVPVAGQKVGDAAVACASCAPHFREKEPCGGCGRPSSRLVWAGEGDLLVRVCPSCRNEVNHATCTYCRRYRHVAGTTDVGLAFCVQCGPTGEAWHDCPVCRKVVRGKGNGRCRECINRHVLEHEAQLIAVTFGAAWTVQLLNGFVRWLLKRDSDSPQLPRILRSHLSFFSSLDMRFSGPEEVHASTLLDHFTVAGMRQHQLAVRYVCEVLNIEVTDEDKKEHVESSRVAAILEKAGSNQWNDDLFQFNLWLIKAERPVRTRRLYLSSAAGLMVSAGAKCIHELDQESLDRHLTKVPGARANLSSLLRFAREHLGHTLTLPVRPPRKEAEPKPVRRLRALLKRIEASGDHAAVTDVESVISVALKIPLRSIQAGKWWPLQRAGRWHIVSSDEEVRCPLQLQDVASRWAALRALA